MKILLLRLFAVFLVLLTYSIYAKNENFSKLAEQGDAEAQNSLGAYIKQGYGVEKDYKKAVYWFTKAAEQE